MIKKLVHHGNSRALIIDKSILKAAKLDEDKAKFQLIVDPNGGILIRSVEEENDRLDKKAMDQVLQENSELFKRLSDR